MLKGCEERIKELEKEIAKLKCVSSIKRAIGIGDTFELAGLKWKILDIDDRGYVCLAEKYGSDIVFDSSRNAWESSDLRIMLNKKLFNEIADEIGAENVIEFERDLLSKDGQTEYGKCYDKVSLISMDEYRKYRALIPNTGNYWWWTITPDSTPCNDDSRWAAVVAPSGVIGISDCNGNGVVRPFCIFSSSIFES